MSDAELALKGADVLLDDALLRDAVEIALEDAKERGASASEAAASLGQGLSVNVRKGELETVEHTRDRNLVVSVYFGNRKIGRAHV